MSMTIKATHFDVLVEELPGPLFQLRQNQEQQIGTNRLNVLIDIHLNSFKLHYGENNKVECDKVLGAIIDVTTCSKGGGTCLPGRFLATAEADKGTWRELDRNECEQLIRRIMVSRCSPVKKRESNFEPLAVDASPNMYLISTGEEQQELMNKPLRKSRSATNLIGDARRFFSFTIEEEEDQFDPMPFNTQSMELTSTDFSPFEIGSGMIAEGSSGKNKRGRGSRTSLLRRSNSFNSGLKFGSKKKTLRGVFHNNCGNLVPAHEGMDVVFKEGCRSLSTKTTIIGNNRLLVMVTLEKETFPMKSTTEQSNTLIELVNTVVQQWNGRILVDKGYAYCILGADKAVDAMRNLFISESDADGVTSHGNKFNPFSLTNPSRNKLFSPTLPAFLRNASNEILHSGRKSNEVTPEERQNTAVRIMKERMKKRQEAKEKEKEKEKDKECKT